MQTGAMAGILVPVASRAHKEITLVKVQVRHQASLMISWDRMRSFVGWSLIRPLHPPAKNNSKRIPVTTRGAPPRGGQKG